MRLIASVLAVGALVSITFASTAEGRPGGGGRGRGGEGAGEAGRGAGERDAGGREAGERGAGDGDRGIGFSERGVGYGEPSLGIGERGAGIDGRGIGADGIGIGRVGSAAIGNVGVGPGQVGAAAMTREQSLARSAALRTNAQAWVNKRGAGPTPFTERWYAGHPNAWQNNHPRANAWQVASLGATGAWLGWDPIDAGPDSAAIAYQREAAGLSSGEWLGLGVFALERPTGGGRQLLQMAVNRTGDLRGVHYDETTASNFNAIGRVKQLDRMAAWRLESNPQLTFTAPLETFTSNSGEVTVSGPDGVETWVAARLEAPQQ